MVTGTSMAAMETERNRFEGLGWLDLLNGYHGGERGRKRWLSNWTQKSTGQDIAHRAASGTKKE